AVPPLRVEVIAHTQPPLPDRLPALSTLQQELYDSQPYGRRTYLSPLFSVTVRSLAEAAHLPGGDVNLTMDQLRPGFTPVGDEGSADKSADSSSFYGLFVRYLPRFRAEEECEPPSGSTGLTCHGTPPGSVIR
ncbi:MAG: hypothetical protein ACRDIF_01710, partial [Actinomycetota bacterium]